MINTTSLRRWLSVIGLTAAAAGSIATAPIKTFDSRGGTAHLTDAAKTQSFHFVASASTAFKVSVDARTTWGGISHGSGARLRVTLATEGMPGGTIGKEIASATFEGEGGGFNQGAIHLKLPSPPECFQDSCEVGYQVIVTLEGADPSESLEAHFDFAVALLDPEDTDHSVFITDP
jgi:hypothetical protein